MLDQHYFDRIQCIPHEGFMLEAYKAVYTRSTIVLFSRNTATPLAAMTLQANDVGCLSMLTGRPSPKDAPEPYVQGMLNMPDQAFTFTISNLSDQGMVNFNILHTPHRVSKVDPGPAFGINKVNELHVNQSYTIEADQRANRQMILSGKIKVIHDPVTVQDEEVRVSVQNTESEGSTDKGLYFYLSVVPDKACHSLVQKFADGTIWKVVPGFVRKVSRTQWRQHVNGLQSISDLASSAQISSMESESMYRNASQRSVLRRVARLVSTTSIQSESTSRNISQRSVHPRGRRLRLLSATVPAPEAPIRRLSHRSFQQQVTSPFVRSSMESASTCRNSSRVIDPQRVALSSMESESTCRNALEESVEDLSGSRSREVGAIDNDSEVRELKPVCFTLAEDVDVGSTQAAKLSYGQHIHVQSGDTGHNYAYEHASEPTVLCMSIWEGMKLCPVARDIEKELMAEIDEWVKTEGKSIIASLNAVYKSETCVIDLESEADTIVCTCGHQCVHHSNVKSLDKCPMCRNPITSFVRADGLLFK